MAQANPTDPRSSGHQTLAKAHSVLANPQTRSAILDILKNEGQGGDNNIVHVNPQEEQMLKEAGGSGGINPTTGLREYDPTGGSNTGGAGHAGDSGNNGGKGGGGTGQVGGGGGFGPGHTDDGSDDGLGYGSIAGMGYNRAGVPGSSTPLGDQNQGQGGWNNADSLARADANGEGDSLGDTIGNFIAHMFGFNETAPQTPIGAPMPPGGWQSQANWGFDPAGLIGGILGAGLGVPGLGMIADQISSWAGRPLAVNLGPDVLAGLGLTSSASNAELGAAMKANPDVGAQAANALGGSDVFGGGSDQGGNQTGTGTGAGTGTETPPPVDPAPTPSPTATYDAELAKLMPGLQNDFNFQAGQRGLDPTQYMDAYNSELAHRQSALPIDFNKGTDAPSIDATLQSMLGANFGNSALDDYQTAQRAGLKGSIDAKNPTDYINKNFADGSDSNIIDQIYNEQFGQAKGLLDNVKARGGLNDLGYSMGIQDLNNQGKAGRASLDTAGNNILASDRGTLNTNLSDIYNKIGGYSLGSSYDPSSDYDTNFTGKGTGLLGDLEGSLRGVAPNIFNTSTLLQKASGSQGATSGGSLLDTLAQRDLNSSQRDRGIGTQGAF